MVNQAVTLKTISHDAASGKESEVLALDLDMAKAKWKVIHSDPNAEKAIDEDPTSFWKSDNNEIMIDLGESISLKGFTYLPPQNRFMSGVIMKYVFESSLDGKNWKVLNSGEFSNIRNNPIKQSVRFEPVEARYIRLKSLQTTDIQLAAFSELGVLTVD